MSEYKVFSYVNDHNYDIGYSYSLQYRTKWMVLAIYHLWILKRKVGNCVKLEWR